MTPGEKRFSERLQSKLEDDYLIWYDVPVGPKQRRPDFVVLHPRRGLLVLEVKDWKLESLHSLDKYTAQLITERGLVKQINPLLQCRDIALELVDALSRDPALVHPSGHAHAGKLRMPWGHGVVLTNISRATFDQAELGNVLPERLVICQDEMTPSMDAEAFQQGVWNMFSYTFSDALSLPQIERVRWHLFPEIRVRPPLQPDLLSPAPADRKLEAIPDLVRVMDLQQEQLARSLGDGHRVIHGVAGSGKTMILGYRCLHLARSLEKPILVLCFNRTLAARLGQVLGAEAGAGRVDVRSFHSWCAQMLRAYHVLFPKQQNGSEAFFAEMVEAVIRAVDRGQIPRAQYGAILIDEGHDFEPAWLKLVVQMLDPVTKSLLLLYDDAQSIYAKRERQKVSFAQLGIEARGRTTILKLNYRNTWEILALAKAFAAEVIDGEVDDEDAPALISPQSVGRHGAPPRLLRSPSRIAETQALADDIAAAHAQGCPLEQIAVICRHWSHAESLSHALAKLGIAVTLAKDGPRKEHLFDEPSVKFVSMHSSKGLEFERVYVPAIDAISTDGDAAAEEAKLLYVAMTRATELLTLSAAGESDYVNRIERVLASLPKIGLAA